MVRHLLVRVLTGIAVIAGVVTLTFLLLHLAPGDPARHLAGPTATAEQLAAMRSDLGLDQPLPRQFGTWLGRAVRGDWGTSLATGRPVGQMLADAWPATALLVILSLSASYLLGILIGLVQVSGSRGRDVSLSTATVTLFAMPGYWLGLLFIWFFAYRMQWLPAFGATGLDADFLPAGEQLVDRLRHLVLPWLTLTLIGVGGAARFVRGSLLDVRGAGYLTAAEGRGLRAATITRRYLLANALGPVVVLLGLSLPALFSGAVFVEGIFAWPGVGRVLIEGVQGRDYPVVMAAATVSAVLVVLGNLLADFLGTWVDPRVRHG
jgi:peptide/nickel transport system permease protein